ncbi:hypothetical protein [Enterobacter hormaechei]|uniref:hypothetical protein n=1 Tax=Enterobacter hormaechei TaxID=158836 RepID=UPI0007C70899|nr:hypothetical protein [Enterobacter hormaechei]HDT1878775.1 hypothetical protein [Enterobacter hormaechei subsp. steigerwaltii]MBW7691572.1 hypothetical protein [Enterobacter hormaechei]MCR2781011.1 hypothetical protein [Enterobacter hormaechei]MCR4042038.1 hypothetical protein [Enterobacter hormaechei]HBO0728143.1 hypothetical protein [Enterobacter hormaechei subsp. xiangfangensis]
MGWSTFWSAASAIATAVAALIAIWAMFRWKKQDELKVKMAFKLAIADYKYLLLQMPPQLNSDDLRNKHFNEKKELNSLLSACNTAFIITEGLLLPNDLVVTSWRNILETHRHYLQGTRKSEELIMYCDAILRQKFIFT